jgi:hypothetical protein
MRSNPARIAIALVAVAVIVVLFVVLSGGDGDDDNQAATTTTMQTTTPSAGKEEPGAPPKPEVPVIRVRGGKPVGGVERLTYTTGERVRFRVVSDVAEEVHVHGFDITRDIPAGGSATFSFPADIEGVYEVELHGTGELIARLEVRPG